MFVKEINCPNIAESHATIIELVTSATQELFEFYGLQATLVACLDSAFSNETDVSIVGLLGAAADGFRSTIAIETNFKILEATYPAKLEELETNDTQHLQDWIGELTNQLVGRFKNKLMHYGCDLCLGVPSVIQGDNLKAILPKKTEAITLKFDTNINHNIYILVNTMIDAANFKLEYQTLPEGNSIMGEGEFMFF